MLDETFVTQLLDRSVLRLLVDVGLSDRFRFGKNEDVTRNFSVHIKNIGNPCPDFKIKSLEDSEIRKKFSSSFLNLHQTAANQTY